MRATLRLQARVWRSVLRSLFGVVPTLDLHGLGVKDALAATERFLREAYDQGDRQVRIVYGKGRGTPGGIGVLRQAVPAWIEQHAGDWVERFERQLDESGHDGSMVLWLRRRRS
jgi:DNA-nicking Smr family endonuclease